MATEITQLPIIELEGSPADMCEAYGEICLEDIHKLYDIRLRTAIVFAREAGRRFTEEQVLEVCRQCLPITEEYDPVGYEEFCGVGRGSGLSPEQVYALNGFTDLRDILGYADLPAGWGCSSLIIAPDRGEGSHSLLGQNWDLQTSNMEHVCLVHRRPNDSPETCSLTVTGALSLIGINSEGICVGNTNLVTTDARIGVQYLSVLHRALNSRSFKEAVEAVTSAPRGGAHYYYVGGPNGEAAGIECTACSHVRFDVTSGTFTHCNHMLDEGNQKLEVERPTGSTCHRQDRLSHLLASHEGTFSPDDLKTYFADHEGGNELAICRHDDLNGASTNACVILSPQTRELHACRAQPHVGEWVKRIFNF